MKVSDATFAVTDTETTGLDSSADELLEIGAIAVDWRGAALKTFETLVAPSRPMTADNSAIHGLIDEDFEGAPRLAVASVMYEDWCPRGAAVRVFHNAAFDTGFMPWIVNNGERVLCTKRLSQHLCPDAPNSKNQTMRYWFKDVARAPHIRELGDAHRALSDATVTAAILPKLLDLYLAAGYPDDIDALIAFAESPILIKKMWLGKHYGKPFEEVPRSYLAWALETLELDKDQRFTIEYWYDELAVAAHA